MKASFDIPDDLYRQLASKVAAEGRPFGEVAIELFRGYLNGGRAGSERSSASVATPKAPAWFGSFKEEARRVRHHDMEAVRRSIARGVVEDREG